MEKGLVRRVYLQLLGLIENFDPTTKGGDLFNRLEGTLRDITILSSIFKIPEDLRTKFANAVIAACARCGRTRQVGRKERRQEWPTDNVYVMPLLQALGIEPPSEENETG